MDQDTNNTKPIGRLSGKVALVTGASRGIGRAIAVRLAREGALIAVHYGRDELVARETERQIHAVGGLAFTINADLKSVEGVGRLFSELERELLQRTGVTEFDVLVNNTGKESSRLRRGGCIINLSSCLTRFAYPAAAAYSMSKGALEVMSLFLGRGCAQLTAL